MAAGQVRPSPPKLGVETDFPSFKEAFTSYINAHNISDAHALDILKTSSLTGTLRDIIPTSGTYQEAFEILSNHFRNPQVEMFNIKNKVIHRGVLPLDHTPDSILNNLKQIEKHLTIFNRDFSPVEDFTLDEITQSIISWVPRDQSTLVIQRSRSELLQAKTERGIQFSIQYQIIVMQAIAKYTSLKIAEEFKRIQRPATSPPLA